MKRTIHDLFTEITRHPDYIGGAIFTVRDIPEGTTLTLDRRDLSDLLISTGNLAIEDNTTTTTPDGPARPAPGSAYDYSCDCSVPGCPHHDTRPTITAHDWSTHQ